jgi:hypothetical protein
MLNDVGIKEEMRYSILAECASTTIFYANMVNCNSGKTTHKLMFGVKFNKLRDLKRFGDMVVVNTNKRVEGTLRDRGTVCMIVGVPTESFGRCLPPA